MIFVVGNSRSGTTMLGRVLGGHPEVFTFNELHFFEQLWNAGREPEPIGHKPAVTLAANLLTIQRDGYFAKRNPGAYLDEAGTLVDAIASPITPPRVFATFMENEAARHGKAIGCDQTPRNLYYLHELLELYPDARAVVIVRDPRDVLLSQKNRWKRRRLGAEGTPRFNALRTWAGYHPITISLLWRSGVRAGDRLADHGRLTPVRFEDLLAEPEKQVRMLCDRLDIPFDPAMLEVPRIGSSHETDRPTETGLDPAAAGRWRHGGLTPTEIAVCQRIAGDGITRHGYDIEKVSPPLGSLVFCRLTWVLKSGLALVLNLRRSKSLVEALRRRLGG